MIPIAVDLSGAVGGQEHPEDSGAHIEGRLTDGRKEQENRKQRWQMAYAQLYSLTQCLSFPVSGRQ